MNHPPVADNRPCKAAELYYTEAIIPYQCMGKFFLATARKILGVVLVILGVAALLTPLTPGSWLAIIGLELLGFGFLWKDILKPILQKIQKKLTNQVQHPFDQ